MAAGRWHAPVESLRSTGRSARLTRPFHFSAVVFLVELSKHHENRNPNRNQNPQNLRSDQKPDSGSVVAVGIAPVWP